MSAEILEAYQRGRTRFLGLDLEVAPGVLVPRAETELLARTAIERLAAIPRPRVVDVCCGSGNLACAIAANLTGARVWAADLLPAAEALTRRNVAALGLSDRVSVHSGDLFAPLLAELAEAGPLDAIVCNPPYISSGRLAERADLAVEPAEAFDGGPYGLTIHQRIIREGLPLLRDEGHLLFEFGAGQARQIQLLFARQRGYAGVALVVDASGEPRVAAATKGPSTNA